MYNKKIMELFQNPVNVGRVKAPDAVGRVGNAICGDIMEISLKIENDIITDAKFKTFGCGVAIAATSVATTMIIGKTIEDALKVKNTDVLKVLGELPAHKIHCSVLAEEAIAAAIEDYHKRQEKAAKAELKRQNKNQD